MMLGYARTFCTLACLRFSSPAARFSKINFCNKKLRRYVVKMKKMHGRIPSGGPEAIMPIKKAPAGQTDRGKKKENEFCCKNYRLIVSSSSNMESAVVMILDAAE